MSESGSTTAAHHYTTTSLDCSSQHGLLARQDHQEPQPQLLHLHLPVSYCITHILTHSPHSLTPLHQSINLSHTHCLFFYLHSLSHSPPFIHSLTYSLPRPLGAPSCSACMCASCTDPTRTSPMTPALGPART